MRIGIWFSLLVISTAVVCGCNGGGAESVPEDKDFQKQLADAAAQKKGGSAERTKSMKKLPAEVTSAMSAPPGAAPAGKPSGAAKLDTQ